VKKKASVLNSKKKLVVITDSKPTGKSNFYKALRSLEKEKEGN